ncbi:glycosyl transferase family 4-domain-containing protein [Melampsora americana]|nr:glycosyl transferase family 4-domain-containing protein [Melampsora americana]
MSFIILSSNIIISIIAYILTNQLIPSLSNTLISAGLKGKDLLKAHSIGGGGFPINPSSLIKPNPINLKSTTNQIHHSSDQFIPESTGLIAGSIYVLVLSIFVPLPYYTHFFSSPDAPGSTAFSNEFDHELNPTTVPFPHSSLSANLASILSLLSAVFLGFLDDVFDIRWRFKLPIPVIASVPLLTAYAAAAGATDIIIPHILGLRNLLGVEKTNGLISIGPLYYLYMSMLSTFCTNSINILAGVNGVEVGQSIIICLSIIFNDLLYIKLDLSDLGIQRQFSFGLSRGSQELEDRHLFSFCLMTPLLGVMLALIKHNWYPARTFVGDTFCYFAGMAFAVVGILGHFSKTVLLFFIPQIFNFLYSCPQLFGLIPIPRHRLPARDPMTDRLKPSMVQFVEPCRRIKWFGLCERLGLVRLLRNREEEVIGCSNLTLLNLLLIWFGEMREDRLTMLMMGFQVLGTLLGFGIRYGMSGLFYDLSMRR